MLSQGAIDLMWWLLLFIKASSKISLLFRLLIIMAVF